jgi:hypothetical protein
MTFPRFFRATDEDVPPEVQERRARFAAGPLGKRIPTTDTVEPKKIEKWVRNSDMHPMTDVYNRRWRQIHLDGSTTSGIYRGFDGGQIESLNQVEWLFLEDAAPDGNTVSSPIITTETVDPVKSPEETAEAFGRAAFAAYGRDWEKLMEIARGAAIRAHGDAMGEVK